MKPPPGPPLAQAIARVFIVAYREDTTRLEAELRAQGFAVSVLRQELDAHTRTFSPNLRCLLNHASGWAIAAEAPGLSLFIEADFAPCRAFGRLPLPFDPALHGEHAWAYIYAGGPRIYEQLPSGHLLAHACSTVAYVMPPGVARFALDYVAELKVSHPDWSVYYPFDTVIQWYLMGRGARAFVPWRQLGEHGGLSNPEHFRFGMGASSFRRLLAYAGVGLNHHADNLAGPLAILPLYAQGRRPRLWRTRIEGRLFGWYRLLYGQTVAPLAPLSLPRRLNLYWRCALRLLS